jgi:antitoxin VapB
MQATAKVFTTGHSQAIRLPKAFRVNAHEMWISKNEGTGEITLKPKDEDGRQQNLSKLFRLIAENTNREEFIPDRSKQESRNPLEEWAAPLPSQTPHTTRKTKTKGSKS